MFTVWLDYFATGEGRHIFATIAPAANADRARKQFAETFGSYWARGAEVAEGIVRNPVTQFLFTEQALKHAEQLVDSHGPGACPEMKASHQFNLS